MVDYKFLLQYLDGEKRRLGKILTKYEIDIRILKNKKDEYGLIQPAYRDWQYGRALANADEKIDNLIQLQNLLKPKYDKIVEQVQVISQL